jgi:hypothetical protein
VWIGVDRSVSGRRQVGERWDDSVEVLKVVDIDRVGWEEGICAIVEHGRGELAHEGVGLQKQILHHDIIVSAAQHVG